MNIGAYRAYLTELIKEAVENTDGSKSEIAEYLGMKKIPRYLVRNKAEKKQALRDAQIAFDEHRHWPVEIIISHLGVDPEEVNLK
jgi:hypothetical protein